MEEKKTGANGAAAKKSAAAKNKATAAKPAAAKNKATAAKKPAAKKTAVKNKARKPVLAREAEDDYGLKLFFQPIFVPAENRIYGYECLMRIVDRELGTITPDVFLSVAQKNASLIKGLEEWSLAELFRTAKIFRDNKKYIEMLSLNIDTSNFFKKDFFQRVSRYFEKITDNICFELKEDAFFSDDAAVAETLSRLRDAGIKIAVDDFTANFLTFDWGDKVPFDIIKIERAYIDRLLTSPKAHLIVEKIVEFARRYNLEMVGVGVENAETEAELIKLGVNKMQGYYYAKPLQIKRLLSAAPVPVHDAAAEKPAAASDAKDEKPAVAAEKSDAKAESAHGESAAENSANDEAAAAVAATNGDSDGVTDK